MKTIYCLGLDDILHFCHPHETTCLCGVEVKQKIGKEPTEKQLEKYGDCGDCDYERDYIEDNV